MARNRSLEKSAIGGGEGERGFTFIEVLVVLFVLSLLAVGFSQLTSNTFTHLTVTGGKTQAIALAQEKMDQLTYLAIKTGYNRDALEAELQNPELGYVESENLYEPVKNPQYHFERRDDTEVDGQKIKGYLVTVVAFFHNNRFKTSATYFLEFGSGETP